MRSSLLVPLATAALVALGSASCDDGGGGSDDTSTDPDLADTVDTAGEADAPADTADTSPDTAVDDGGTDAPVDCDDDGDCDDSNPCTADSCDLDINECAHDPIDADGDGYFAAEIGGTTCTGNDCDDANDNAYPGAALDCAGGNDFDCDDLPDDDEDGDGYAPESCGGDDCDDSDADAFPGSASDPCSTADLDCNGHPEEDNDGDGHESDSCSGDDCDDEDPFIYFGATERACNGLDDDCNGEMSATEDADHDGYANATCVASGMAVDCDDRFEVGLPVHPGATEICDMTDQDCDGSLLDGPGADDDGDGVPDATCGGTDCNDASAAIHGAFAPGAGITDPSVGTATEICDTTDQDCDGSVIDAPGADDDLDGHIDQTCGGDDCDDFDNGVYTGAAEDCGDDHDCDGLRDDDQDSDGHSAPTAGTHSCGGDDCDDGNPLAYTGAAEICGNGVDEDCDGNSDGLTSMAGEVQITVSDSAHSQGQKLTWTGSEYGIVFYDARDPNYDVYLARVSGAGVKVGSDIAVTNHPSPGTPDGDWPRVAWSGSEFGIVWRDDRDGNAEIYFAAVSPTGSKRVSDVRLTNDAASSYDPGLDWNGSSWGVAWTDARGTAPAVMMMSVNATTGAPGGAGNVVSQGSTTSWGYAAFTWDGSYFGIAYGMGAPSSDVYFTRATAAGNAAGSLLSLATASTYNSNYPSVAWSGSEYGVAWADYRDSDMEIYFARVTSIASKIGSDIRITNNAGMSIYPSLSWTGSMYGVCWQDYRDGQNEIYVGLFTPMGVRIGTDIRVTTNDLDQSERPDMVWTGSEFGVVWGDTRTPWAEVFFARMGFCE